MRNRYSALLLLALTSTGGAHACRIDGLGFDTRIPADGAAIAFDITPTPPSRLRRFGGPRPRSIEREGPIRREGRKVNP